MPVRRVLSEPVSEVVELDGRLLSGEALGRTSRLMDILSLDELYGLNQTARMVASAWYWSRGVDQTLWEPYGVSVGDCLRFHVGVGVVRHLRLRSVIQRLIDTRQPRSIYLWGDGPAVAVRDGKVGQVRVSRLLPTRDMRMRQRFAGLAVRGRCVAQSVRQQLHADDVHRGGDLPPGQHHLVAPADATMGEFVRQIADRLDAGISSGANDWGDDAAAARAVRGLVDESWGERCSALSLDDALSHVPLDMREDLSDVLGWLLADLYASTTEMLVTAVGLARLNELKHVDAVVLPMIWGGRLRSLGQAAQHMGIPTFVVQDGILAPHNKSNLPPVRADHALVLGPSGVKWFTEAGLPEGRVVVAGRCLWGRDLSLARPARTPGTAGRIPTVLYLAPRPTLYAAQYSLNEAAREIEAVCSAVAAIADCRLVVRLHPRAKEFPGAAWARRLRHRLRVDLGLRGVHFDSEGSLEESVASAAVVVCYLSTTILQAACAGKPVVVVDLSGRGDSSSWSGWPLINSPDEIGPAVRRGLACRDESSSQFSFGDVTEHVSEGIGLEGVAAYIANVIG